MTVISRRKPRAAGHVLELHAPKALRFVDRPPQEPAPGQLTVDVRAVGICGTDLHAYRGRSDHLPIVLGHDVVGIVSALGDDVHRAVMGRRVVLDPSIYCKQCTYCARGLTGLCSDGGYMGMTHDGAMAEHLIVPADTVTPVPDSIDDVAATVLEPIVVTLRMLERTTPLLAEPIASIVLGGGPLGILLARMLVTLGHSVTLLEPQAGRRQVADSLGLLTASPDQSLSLPDGPRLIVETSASAAGTRRALDLAHPGSVLAVIGRSAEPIPSAELLLSELAVVGVKGGSERYGQALETVTNSHIDTAAVVSHKFAFSDAPAAFEAASTDPDRVLRTVLIFD